MEGLLGLPAAALAVYLLLLVLPRIDPRRRSYDLFAGAYAALRFASLAVLAAVYGLALLSVQGYPVAVERLVPAVVGIFLVVTGNLMGKIRPNWFVGVRTPWTLTSSTAWGKTNRLAGWLLIGAGVAMIAAGLMGWPWLLAGVPRLAAGLAVLLVVYSYFAWRRDPRKENEAGTSTR